MLEALTTTRPISKSPTSAFTLWLRSLLLFLLLSRLRPTRLRQLEAAQYLQVRLEELVVLVALHGLSGC